MGERLEAIRERLEAIRERLEAIPDILSPPWAVMDWARGRSVVTEDSDPMEGPIHEVARVPDVSIGGDGDLYSTPEFIAHAPTDLRYLLDRIEAQREVVGAAREVFPLMNTPDQSPEVRLYARKLRDALDELEEQTDD